MRHLSTATRVAPAWDSWRKNLSSNKDGASLEAQLVKNPPAIRRPQLNSWVRKIPWRRDRLPTPVFLGSPGGSDSKESTWNARDLGSVPGLGRPSGGGHGNPLQYPCLENPHGQRSLVGYSAWGHQESDTTGQLSTAQHNNKDSAQ